MRQKLLLTMLLLLSIVAPVAAFADSFTVKSTDLTVGTTETLQFNLENSQAAYGFQAEVKLPAGLTAVKGSDGQYITLSERADGGNYSVNSNILNGNLIMGAFSGDHKPLAGNSGALVNLNVKVDDDFEGGKIEILNASLINSQDKDVALSSSSADLGVAVSTVTFISKSLTLQIGKTTTLVPTVTPSWATNQTLTWKSSDETVATVSSSGLVTAVKVGNANITATSSNGKTATCAVNVETNVIEVTSITLDATELNLTAGETKTLVATVRPDNATDKSVAWSSNNEKIATVDENGNVTAIAKGTAVITAEAHGHTATCTVTVAAKTVAVTGVTLNKTTLSLTEGETGTLTATVTPSDATDKTITWASSDEKIVTVKNGIVTAIAPGTATITVTASGKTATCEVTVKAKTISVTGVTLNKTTLNMTVGDKATLTATITPENATDKSVTWTSSNTAVATVDATGNVTAVAPGTATITAKAGEKTATCAVTVAAKIIPATGVTLSNTTSELKVGETVNLTATVTPEDATDKTIVWTSSDETIATVDATGKVTAKAIGEAIVTATCGTAKATCKVTVVPTPVESIKLSNTTLALAEGDKATLTATIAPASATDKSVTWTSSDESVATVSEAGEVTAVKAGTATITATSSNGKTATCNVTVSANIISVTGITISKTELDLTEGDKATLTATITPENATDKTVTWTSSDESVATVSEAGEVTAVKAGSATITAASSNGKTATCTVTVAAKVIDVTGITLDKTALSLTEGETATLKATVVPENATDPTVTWTSSDETVATVKDGVVTAVAPGTATITAKAGEKSATCTVTVAAKVIDVTGITLDKTALSLTEGETATLKATIAPENATDPTVTWTSSDETVATVKDGVVTAVAPGTATITAKAGEKTASCTVTVVAKVIDVTSVSLDKTALSITEGETATLKATVAPENATDPTVTWTSSDETVATVTNGVVTAVAPGTATITAKAGEKTASCEVTVTAKTIIVTGVTLDKTTLSLIEGETATLKATVAPADATDKTVTWTSSDETVATVKNGVVTAVAAGTATITVTASGKTAECKVTVKTDDRTSVPVKMTYVNMDDADKAYGEIAQGETAEAGFNKISGGSVAFGNTGWGVNYITYLQVNVSEIKGTILSATLSFEASGSTDSKRQTAWGVGYNNSVWSADMTYNSADKSITLLGGTQSTATKSATTFETFSFDITEAVLNAENGLATILVYETAAAGGYIKNPVVKVKWTEAETYKVTFKETNGVEATVKINNQDVTQGTSLIDGTYTFTATANGYKDYEGEFTVAGAAKEVEFTMTPKDTWNWTLKNNVNEETITGTCLEGESATAAYSRYILKDGTVWMKAPCGGDKKLEYNYTFTPDANNYVGMLEYTEKATDGIYFIEAEKMAGMTASTSNNANIRCSDSAGAYPTEAGAVEVTKLLPGTYKVEIAFMGGRNTDTDPTFFVKAGENTVLEGTTNGSWTNPVSQEFTLDAETMLTVEGGSASRPLDYVLITGTETQQVVDVTNITLDKTEATLTEGETLTLTATVAPENATDPTVTWTSSDEKIATVKDGVVTAVAAGTVTITAKAGEKTATCEVTVNAKTPDVPVDPFEGMEKAIVKMTYVNYDDPDKSYGEIPAGETAISGFNGNSKGVVNNGTLGFGNTGWGVNYITYLQVNVSEIEGKILKGILSFEASGSTDSKRATGWGAGYNSSVWSADMTYNTADKNITKVGDEVWTKTKSATTFENLTIDITEALNHAEDGVITLIVYETAAAGGYIKIPAVYVEATTAQTYDVTFKETNGVEATVKINNQDVTNGTSLPDGTYTYSATAKGYKDYSGEFTVAGADKEVEFTMTPKATWNWTLKNNVNDETITGTCLEGESATAAYSRYILKDGTVWMKAPCGGDKKLEYNYTFTPDADNYVGMLEYTEKATDGIYFIEAEKMAGMTASTSNNANIRCSDSAGAYPTESGAVEVTKLLPGTYKVEIAFMGGRNTDTDPTFFVKAGENTVLEGTTNGSWTNPVSQEFTLDTETVLTVEGGSASRPLDYVLITGAVNTNIPVTGLEIRDEDDQPLDKEHTLSLHTGDEYTLTEVVYPENATDQKVTWTSSDEAIAKIVDIVEEPHQVHIDAISAGEATITATLGDFSTSFKVIVTDPVIPVTGITLDKKTAEMLTGETLQLNATIAPEDATSKEIKWTSSDNNTATVSTKGLVTAKKAGKVTITATANKFTATCEITITDPIVDVAGITLDKTEATLEIGESVKLTATVAPENATDKSVTWTSSNAAVATVDRDGNVTAVAAGEAIITAKAGDKTAECKVTVNKEEEPVVPVADITLDKTEATLKIGESVKLTATVAPENATDKSVVWTSSNAAVATVDRDGNVTAVAAGEAIITAKAGDKTAECKVTVIETGILLDITSADMFTGEILKLSFSIVGVDIPAKSVKWSSSDDNIAVVNPKGMVTAKRSGKVTITAEAENYKATCEITVKDPAVISITLNKTEETIAVGETLKLFATLETEGKDATVTWTSSDESVATVDINGLVTAVGVGNVTIVATAGDKTAECQLTVEEGDGVALIGFDSDAPVKVYDLNGRHIADDIEGLQGGFYIVRQGNKAKKIRIR